MPAFLRASFVALFLTASGASTGSAQFTPLTVPRGTVAIDLLTRSETWSRLYRDGVLGSAGADFASGAIGGDLLPALASTEARLARLTGLTGQILNAGRFGVSQMTTVGEFGLGLQIGITSRLTVSGMVPFQRVRVQTITRFDSTDATVGFNPADPTFGDGAGLGATLSFFTEFDAAIEALSDGLTNGTWAGDPALQTLAVATLADAESMRNDLYALLVDSESRSPFVPLGSSPAGAALTGSITLLQVRISNGLGIPGFTRQPALATTRLTPETWNQFLEDGNGPVAGSVASPIFTAVGDIELGAAYLLVNRGVQGDWGTSVRMALRGTVRLRTSQLDNPNRFFDQGTGQRQPDGEAALVTDLARGRGALRLQAWYNRQFAGNQQRRIGPPDQPIQYLNTLAALRVDPGDVIGVTVLPAYRFTPRLAFLAGLEWWTRGEDAYRYAEGQAPLDGLDPNVLAEGSSAQALTLRAGLTWSHPGGGQDGRGGSPLDASVTWEKVISGSGGRVPQLETVRAGLRIYIGFW